EDDALRLVVVEVGLVLEGAGVAGPHDLQALGGQALELLDLALVEPEPCDALKLSHHRNVPNGQSRERRAPGRPRPHRRVRKGKLLRCGANPWNVEQGSAVRPRLRETARLAEPIQVGS